MSDAWAIDPTCGDAVARSYAPAENPMAMPYAMVGDVARLPFVGVITPTPTVVIVNGAAIPVGTSCSGFRAALAAIDASPKAKSLHILVDSPGGMVQGVRAAMQALRDFSKPSLVEITGNCASAAVWITSAADRIVAHSTAKAGCIGVMLPIPISDGKFKRFISSATPDKLAQPGTEGDAQYQAIAEDFCDQMLTDIGENRGVARDAVAERFGAGAIMAARKALAVGLIDGLVGPAVSTLTPTNDGAQAIDTSTPALAGMEVPVKEQTDPAEMSREDLEAEVRKLRGDDTQDEEVAADDNGGAPDETPDKEEEAMSQPAAASAADVSKDIELNKLREQLAQATARLGVTQLHAAQARAQVKAQRIDAVIESGRVGTSDAHRKVAELAYDAEMASAEAYAVANGVDLATALAACPVRTFSELEALAPGSGNPSLGSSSIGGGPAAKQATAKATIVAEIEAKARENKTTYAVEIAAWREANPGEYVKHFGGAK